MIAYMFGLDFLAGLFGCMRFGALACSVFPPNPSSQRTAQTSMAQFAKQVEDAGATCALTNASFKRTLQLYYGLTLSKKSKAQWIATDEKISSLLKKQNELLPEEERDLPSPEDIAFIQYSSGSTGTPKGIVIGHSALVYNICAVLDDVIDEILPNPMTVSWMPQYRKWKTCLLSQSVFSHTTISITTNLPLYIKMILVSSASS